MKEPNIVIYFFFPPITQWCSISDVLFTGGRGVSDFSVLEYYQLNINYSVNILSECLCILIDCSQLSKTYYNMLFGSSTRIVMHNTCISGRSENNVKCVVVHDDLRQKNRTTRYNCRLFLQRHWLYKWFSQFHSYGTYSVLSQSPSIVFTSFIVYGSQRLQCFKYVSYAIGKASSV